MTTQKSIYTQWGTQCGELHGNIIFDSHENVQQEWIGFMENYIIRNQSSAHLLLYYYYYLQTNACIIY